MPVIVAGSVVATEEPLALIVRDISRAIANRCWSSRHVSAERFDAPAPPPAPPPPPPPAPAPPPPPPPPPAPADFILNRATIFAAFAVGDSKFAKWCKFRCRCNPKSHRSSARQSSVELASLYRCADGVGCSAARWFPCRRHNILRLRHSANPVSDPPGKISRRWRRALSPLEQLCR